MIKFLKHILTAISLTTVSLALIISCFTAWILYTTDGAKLVYQAWKKFNYLPFNLSIGQWEGNLVHGLTFKNMDITGLSLLPIGAQIKVQQVDMTFKGLQLHDAYGKFTNARMLLPGTDPLVVQANVEKGILTANIFARTIDIGEMAGLLPLNLRKGILSGFVTHVDLVIKGNLDRIALDGRLIVDRIQYTTTVVSDGPGEIHLVFTPPFTTSAVHMTGLAQMTEGKVQARRIMLDLGQSRVMFKGDVTNPQLDIHASSVIDKITIDVGFKGTLKNPEMIVASDPPMSSDVLLIMLATGKTFGGSSAIKDNGKISGELVTDFIDYSLLGGQGGGFAKRYGLSVSNVQYDNEGKKIGLKKKITEDMRIGVEIEQMPYILNRSTEYSKKVEGEVDVTEHLSVNVSQKVLPREDKSKNIGSNQTSSSKGESEIYLKYQSRF